MFCPFCGAKVEKLASRCDTCGQAVPLTDPPFVNSCPSCHMAVRPGATRCQNCGLSLTMGFWLQTCLACGQTNRKSWPFCIACSTELIPAWLRPAPTPMPSVPKTLAIPMAPGSPLVPEPTSVQTQPPITSSGSSPKTAPSSGSKWKRPTGMPAFLVIWFGQLVSLVGSSMTGFAIAIYVWQLTGSATSFSLMAVFFLLPNLVFAPFAGALVDRWNRKLTMMVSDIAGLVVNLVMLALLTRGHLEMWHLYALNVFNGIFLAFQWPAYSASISMMLEKKHFARASALMSVAQSSSTILAPVIAAVLIVLIQISGIILLDAISFLIAIITLMLVIIPQPPKTELAKKARSNLLREAAFGFVYIAKYPSLLGLQLTFFFGNLLAAFGNILSTPMILAHTSNNVTALATVQTVAGIGGVAGGLIISIWGGPKRRINGVIGGWLLTFCGLLMLGLVQGAILWAIAMFLLNFAIPLVNSSNQAIWQAKIPPEIQGKVFSARLLIAQIAAPISMLAAGPLADKIFEPLMHPGGGLSYALGGVFGTGPGSGMSFMMAVVAVLGILIAIICYAIPAIRKVETIAPDFVLPQETEAAAEEQATEEAKEKLAIEEIEAGEQEATGRIIEPGP